MKKGLLVCGEAVLAQRESKHTHTEREDAAKGVQTFTFITFTTISSLYFNCQK